MKEEKDYIRNIADIRSMMERSSKFLSLTGWAGIMAGIYALAGAFIAYTVFNFNPDEVVYSKSSEEHPFNLLSIIILAFVIFIFSIVTAIFLSAKKAEKRGESVWNATAKRLVITMSVPILVGGLLVLILISKNLIGFIAPFTLLFYGLSLFNASKFTYEEVRTLGLVQIALGLVGCYFVQFGLLFWALGFGVVHIIYGIYMYYRYEK